MRLEKASDKAIRYACMTFHYAKAVPLVSTGYSVFNDAGEWCGVVCYGPGAGDKMASHYGLSHGQFRELVRVALNGKQESTSKAVAISLRLLRKDCPTVRLVFSYADVDQNHAGTIYQATNWIYLGQTEPYHAGWRINGTRRHRRMVGSLLKKYRAATNDTNVKKYLDPNAESYYSDGKRKYIQVFDKSLLKKYQGMAKPYPKLAALAHTGEQPTSSREGAFDSTMPLNENMND